METEMWMMKGVLKLLFYSRTSIPLLLSPAPLQNAGIYFLILILLYHYFFIYWKSRDAEERRDGAWTRIDVCGEVGVRPREQFPRSTARQRRVIIHHHHVIYRNEKEWRDSFSHSPSHSLRGHDWKDQTTATRLLSALCTVHAIPFYIEN